MSLRPDLGWWLAALAPGLAATGVSLLLAAGVWPNPRLFVRGELSAFVLLGGAALSVFCLMAVWLWRRGEGRWQAARAEAAADRRRFLQRLDHELKNPLTAVRAGLANLAVEPVGDAAAVAGVEEQVKRISRLTADLRKLAELEARPLELSQVDVGELLEQAVEVVQMRPEAATRRLTLTLPRAPWPLPPISADHDLLLLVAINLLDNALKFSRADDTIEVRAIEDGNSVAIEIADTGPGIAEEDLPHIWEELFRGKGARGVPGSGLGLALVRAIVERHGGRVSLRSRLGQGTVFSLRLPVAG